MKRIIVGTLGYGEDDNRKVYFNAESIIRIIDLGDKGCEVAMGATYIMIREKAEDILEQLRAIWSSENA